MTQTWSTASSSMCWVSSINSSTSRNMSLRLSGPRSRASRRITGPLRSMAPVADNKHRVKDTDSSSMIPDIFPSLPPPNRCCLPVCRAAEQCDAPRTHSRTQLDPFYLESLRSGGFKPERIGFNGVEKVQIAFREEIKRIVMVRF